jgi:integrase
VPHLTDVAIPAIHPPPTGTVTLWDSGLKGFGVRVSRGGTKTFIVLIASGRRQRIGRYPLISLSDTRAVAKRILAEKTLGRVRPTFTAFEDAKENYLTDCAHRLKPLTVKLYRRHLTVHYPFGRTGVADITSRQIVTNLNKLSNRPSEKEHATRIGRTFFRWCVQQHLIDRSPMENMAVSVGKSRERVLSDAELAAVYKSARGSTTQFARLVSLLILCGQRRTETASLHWAWIDGHTITIPGEYTKNVRMHHFPIGPEAVSVIETIPRIKGSPYLFPAARQQVKGKPTTVMTGFGAAKRNFDKTCGVTNWTLHDLRRTFSTGWQKPIGSIRNC